MPIKSEGFEDLLVVGNKEHDLLLKNLSIVIADCKVAACITELWANDIILAFEASGYRIVKDESVSHCKIRSHLITQFCNLDDKWPQDTNTEFASVEDENAKWIYESPDKGRTIYRRPFGDHDTPREQIDRSQIPRIYDKTQESIIR